MYRAYNKEQDQVSVCTSIKLNFTSHLSYFNYNLLKVFMDSVFNVYVQGTPPVHPSNHTCPVSSTCSMKYERSYMEEVTEKIRQFKPWKILEKLQFFFAM